MITAKFVFLLFASTASIYIVFISYQKGLIPFGLSIAGALGFLILLLTFLNRYNIIKVIFKS